MLNIAVRAARRAGDIIVRQFDRTQGFDVSTKGYNDFVTEVDKAAESAIIDILSHAYPDHNILAEESGAIERDSEFQWIIDPLDGTTNFLHAYPQFAVSIALAHRGKLDQAVIYDPVSQELFTASRGRGAQLNSRRIRVSKHKSLAGGLIGTGFPIRNFERLDDYLTSFKAILQQTSGIRRAGAASLDLAYVACGRLDGFWEYGLNKWDVAAGALLVEEAGGLVADADGSDTYLETGNILAANPKVFDALADLLNN